MLPPPPPQHNPHVQRAIKLQLRGTARAAGCRSRRCHVSSSERRANGIPVPRAQRRPRELPGAQQPPVLRRPRLGLDNHNPCGHGGGGGGRKREEHTRAGGGGGGGAHPACCFDPARPQPPRPTARATPRPLRPGAALPPPPQHHHHLMTLPTTARPSSRPRRQPAATCAAARRRRRRARRRASRAQTPAARRARRAAPPPPRRTRATRSDRPRTAPPVRPFTCV
jgi:hypothetical protein